jgi:hypothetical protein
MVSSGCLPAARSLPNSPAKTSAHLAPGQLAKSVHDPRLAGKSIASVGHTLGTAVPRRHSSVRGRESGSGRFCCKSRKLQGAQFFATTRDRKRSLIRMGLSRITEVA